MRQDERLKVIYQTAATMIVRHENAWRDYLNFASRIHKHDFDTALLVYVQNPNISALATMEQWNRIGRSVNKGAKGIAVCNYQNARLTISYLFDLSQTSGREIKMTDWKLDETKKAELAERFVQANNLTATSFSEAIYEFSAEKAAERKKSFLQSVSAHAQNHIFSELPEYGLEAQFSALLADSISYLIGKRCGLTDGEIITGDGMNTISHFNTVPLIAALGNAVTSAAKERYGRMALEYLMENHPDRYTALKMDGSLMEKMHRVQKEASDRIETLTQQMLQDNPMPQTEGTMERTRHLNSLKRSAEETVLSEIVLIPR